MATSNIPFEAKQRSMYVTCSVVDKKRTANLYDSRNVEAVLMSPSKLNEQIFVSACTRRKLAHIFKFVKLSMDDRKPAKDH